MAEIAIPAPRTRRERITIPLALALGGLFSSDAPGGKAEVMDGVVLATHGSVTVSVSGRRLTQRHLDLYHLLYAAVTAQPESPLPSQRFTLRKIFGALGYRPKDISQANINAMAECLHDLVSVTVRIESRHNGRRAQYSGHLIDSGTIVRPEGDAFLDDAWMEARLNPLMITFLGDALGASVEWRLRLSLKNQMAKWLYMYSSGMAVIGCFEVSETLARWKDLSRSSVATAGDFRKTMLRGIDDLQRVGLVVNADLQGSGWGAELTIVFPRRDEALWASLPALPNPSGMLGIPDGVKERKPEPVPRSAPEPESLRTKAEMLSEGPPAEPSPVPVVAPQPPVTAAEALPVAAQTDLFGQPVEAPQIGKRRKTHPAFDAFWSKYPRQSAPVRAETAFANAVKRRHKPDTIIAGMLQWIEHWTAAGTPMEYIPFASSFLNEDRFLETPVPVSRKKPALAAAGAREVAPADRGKVSDTDGEQGSQDGGGESMLAMLRQATPAVRERILAARPDLRQAYESAVAS